MAYNIVTKRLADRNGVEYKQQFFDTGGGLLIPYTPGSVLVPSAAVLRPAGDATQVTAGDLLANDSAAGNVVPMAFPVALENAGSGLVRKVRLKTDDVNFLNQTVCLHLFKNSPVPTVGDNGVFNNGTIYAVAEANYLGSYDVTFTKRFSDLIKGWKDTPNEAGSDIGFDTLAGLAVIYGLLETRSTVTPQAAGKTFTAALEVVR